MKANPEDARKLILSGKAIGPMQVTGGLSLGGCTGLTALPDGLSVTGGLYVQAPAPLLTGAKFSCGSLRPVDDDRDYWLGLLDLEVGEDACYEEIFEAVSEISRAALLKRSLEEWQKVVVRKFRG